MQFFGVATYRRRPLGRSSRKGEYEIKMELKGIGWGEVNGIKLAQDRDRMKAVLKVLIKYCLPLNSGNFFSSCRAITWSESSLIREVR
jgi:hypothetical protein